MNGIEFQLDNDNNLLNVHESGRATPSFQLCPCIPEIKAKPGCGQRPRLRLAWFGVRMETCCLSGRAVSSLSVLGRPSQHEWCSIIRRRIVPATDDELPRSGNTAQTPSGHCHSTSVRCSAGLRRTPLIVVEPDELQKVSEEAKDSLWVPAESRSRQGFYPMKPSLIVPRV